MRRMWVFLIVLVCSSCAPTRGFDVRCLDREYLYGHLDHIVVEVLAQVRSLSLPEEDPFSIVADKGADLEQVLLALLAIERTDEVTEPPTFWSSIANSEEYSAPHRHVCAYELLKRHVLPGMTLGELALVLDRPNWLLPYHGVKVYEHEFGPPGFYRYRLISGFTFSPFCSSRDRHIGQVDVILTLSDFLDQVDPVEGRPRPVGIGSLRLEQLLISNLSTPEFKDVRIVDLEVRPRNLVEGELVLLQLEGRGIERRGLSREACEHIFDYSRGGYFEADLWYAWLHKSLSEVELREMVADVRAEIDTERLREEDPFSIVADKEAKFEHVLLALLAIERSGNVTEPPTFWSTIANSPQYAIPHRRVCAYELCKRHVSAGMTLGRLSQVLDRPTWIWLAASFGFYFEDVDSEIDHPAAHAGGYPYCIVEGLTFHMQRDTPVGRFDLILWLPDWLDASEYLSDMVGGFAGMKEVHLVGGVGELLFRHMVITGEQVPSLKDISILSALVRPGNLIEGELVLLRLKERGIDFGRLPPFWQDLVFDYYKPEPADSFLQDVSPTGGEEHDD